MNTATAVIIVAFALVVMLLVVTLAPSGIGLATNTTKKDPSICSSIFYFFKAVRARSEFPEN